MNQRPRLEDVVARSRRGVVGFLQRTYALPAEEAEDLYHDAVILLMRKLAEGDLHTPSGAILLRLAHGLGANRARTRRTRADLRHRRAGELAPRPAAPVPSDAVLPAEVLTALQDAPTELREIYLLRVVLGHSAREVGRRMGLSPGSVDRRRDAMAQRLRDALDTPTAPPDRRRRTALLAELLRPLLAHAARLGRWLAGHHTAPRRALVLAARLRAWLPDRPAAPRRALALTALLVTGLLAIPGAPLPSERSDPSDRPPVDATAPPDRAGTDPAAHPAHLGALAPAPPDDPARPAPSTGSPPDGARPSSAAAAPPPDTPGTAPRQAPEPAARQRPTTQGAATETLPPALIAQPPAADARPRCPAPTPDEEPHCEDLAEQAAVMGALDRAARLRDWDAVHAIAGAYLDHWPFGTFEAEVALHRARALRATGLWEPLLHELSTLRDQPEHDNHLAALERWTVEALVASGRCADAQALSLAHDLQGWTRLSLRRACRDPGRVLAGVGPSPPDTP